MFQMQKKSRVLVSLNPTESSLGNLINLDGQRPTTSGLGRVMILSVQCLSWKMRSKCRILQTFPGSKPADHRCDGVLESALTQGPDCK